MQIRQIHNFIKLSVLVNCYYYGQIIVLWKCKQLLHRIVKSNKDKFICYSLKINFIHEDLIGRGFLCMGGTHCYVINDNHPIPCNKMRGQWWL